ncbi:MAG TPA: hypothetical protein VJS44_20385 [Pyrinomonadaceae bacterium]|nr:hypothetical protein [Pyrinomonadaceae bacterium]
MKSRQLLLLLLIATLLGLTGWTVHAQRQAAAAASTARPVWEYRIVSESEKIKLNDLGAEGWELVAVEMSGAEEVYFFKRAK